MIEAGIHNGDMVIVRQQTTASNGEIIVAMTEDDEATVKRFFKEKNHIRLQPENSLMEPLLFKNITILGQDIGLYRDVIYKKNSIGSVFLFRFFYDIHSSCYVSLVLCRLFVSLDSRVCDTSSY